MRFHSIFVRQRPAHCSVQFRLPGEISRLRRSIQRHQRLEINPSAIQTDVRHVRRLNSYRAARLERDLGYVRIKGNRSHMVLHCGLELHALHRLFLYLQLRYINGRLQLRIFHCSLPAHVQVHAAGNLHVARDYALQFFQPEILRPHSSVVPLGLGEIIYVGPRRPRRHLHRQVCFHGISIAFKLHLQVLYRLRRNFRFRNGKRSLSHGIELRSVNRNVERQGATHRISLV